MTALLMNTVSAALPQHHSRTGGWGAWFWSALLLAAALYTLLRFGAAMDAYEVTILLGAVLGSIALGWHWPPWRTLSYAVAALALLGIYLYGGDLDASQQSFWLKYLLASQSAIMWMSALFVSATVVYVGFLLSGSQFTGQVATGLTWCGAAAGFIGLLVRWRESYLISPDVGHIPVSNLYEVFILFCIMTSLIYLYYERKHATRALGAFVMLVVSAAVAFLLWYTFDRQAHQIQPLVPALNSYWMKIHVPANFVGYACFSIAAMLGAAYLVRSRLRPGALSARMPSLLQLDELTYKSIALGFAFFTVATILGALWAAEAWGGYWSWDPKETWALIVWLNYAAWLHMRISKGWSGRPMAWWAIVGLFVTLFAFLGVNMFLSGLHSYGEL